MRWSALVWVCVGALGLANQASSGAGQSPASPPTVRLQVTSVALSLNKLRAAGISFPKVETEVTALESAADRIFNKSDDGPGWDTVDENSPILKRLEEILSAGHAQVLAKSHLTTPAGRPASMSIGGEIPILVPQSNATVAVEWKKYGTQIDIIPIVVDQTIRLELRLRVSELDPDHGIVLEGTEIPGLKVGCDVEFGVAAKPGQVLVLFGPRQMSGGAEALAEGEGEKKPEEESQTLILIRPQLAE